MPESIKITDVVAVAEIALQEYRAAAKAKGIVREGGRRDTVEWAIKTAIEMLAYADRERGEN